MWTGMEIFSQRNLNFPPEFFEQFKAAPIFGDQLHSHTHCERKREYLDVLTQANVTGCIIVILQTRTRVRTHTHTQPHRQVVSEELHDQGAVLIGFLGQVVQLRDGIVKRLQAQNKTQSTT